MIDLFSVKRNSTYNFVQADLPTADGTWLVSESSASYTKGHSYRVASSVATRIETQLDNNILFRRYPTIRLVTEWIKNPFYARRALQRERSFENRFNDQFFYPVDLRRKWASFFSVASYFTFASGVVSNVTADSFNVDDLVQFEGGLRNNVFSYVTAVSGETITLDNDEIRDTSENSICFMSDMPREVENVISQMMHYDLVLRGNPTNLSSETIGNYSYSKETVSIGGLDYPQSMVTSLNIYRRAEFVS